MYRLANRTRDKDQGSCQEHNYHRIITPWYHLVLFVDGKYSARWVTGIQFCSTLSSWTGKYHRCIPHDTVIICITTFPLTIFPDSRRAWLRPATSIQDTSIPTPGWRSKSQHSQVRRRRRTTNEVKMPLKGKGKKKKASKKSIRMAKNVACMAFNKDNTSAFCRCCCWDDGGAAVAAVAYCYYGDRLFYSCSFFSACFCFFVWAKFSALSVTFKDQIAC